jgi:hypothetical protein
MQEMSGATAEAVAKVATEGGEPETVSTHVLVSEDQVQKLRDLSRRTRIAQSEYLREAVDDLLHKYGRDANEVK